MKYAMSNEGRIEATPKANGICQCCESDLIAKCGTRKIWHWAHKDTRNCDHWWENETQWHRDWKDNFPKEWQEVVHLSEDGEKHIADVKTPNGLVVAFLHFWICSRNTSGYIDPAPIRPKPPAFETAEAKRQPLHQAKPPCIMGYLIAKSFCIAFT